VTHSSVVVEWIDAHADPSGGWQTETDQRAYVVTSVGWLMPEDDGGKPGHVTLAQSIGRMEGDAPEAYDHVLHLPRDMVRSIRKVL